MSLKNLLFSYIFLFFSLTSSYAQVTIAKQSFEASGDTWVPMTLSTPACNDSGDDIWDYVTSLSSITPNDGSQFWGIKDLNGNCGSNGFETITLPNVDVSSYTSVAFSFDYNAFEFDTGDDLKYELFYDNISQGEVVVLDGAANLSTSGWVTETVTIPGTVTNVRVVLYARQNGGGDYGGFDNVFLEGTSSCTPATISSVSPNSAIEGASVTITASSGDLTGGSVLFNGLAATITSSNVTTIVCTVPTGATSGDLTIIDSQPCTTTYSTFTVLCSAVPEPTSSSTTLNFSDVQCDKLTFDWVNGDGTNRIVVMSTSSISGTPTDQTSYIANSTFGSGSLIAAGEFVVYNGNSNSTTVTGLALNTNYFVTVFEYNGTTANCNENYLLSQSLAGNETTITSCLPVCPCLNNILVNSCGESNEQGKDEYLVFTNGNSSLAISDITIDFPSGGTYCNSGCGANTFGNNAAYINALNTTAGCTKFVHIDPIPAGANVIVFTGQAPGYMYDFSSMCGSGEQTVVLFANYSGTSGRFANAANANRTTTLTWGSCSQSATYFSSNANTGDVGDFANFDDLGVVSYSNNGGCLAAALPAEINYFDVVKSKKGVLLTWETWSEQDAAYFDVLKSNDGLNYKSFKSVTASGNSNEIIKYTSEDLNPSNGLSYYQLDLINFNGEREKLGTAIYTNKELAVSIQNHSTYWSLVHPETTTGEVLIYSANGVLLSSVIIIDYTTEVTKLDLPKGVYLIQIRAENMVWTTKVVK